MRTKTAVVRMGPRDARSTTLRRRRKPSSSRSAHAAAAGWGHVVSPRAAFEAEALEPASQSRASRPLTSCGRRDDNACRPDVLRKVTCMACASTASTTPSRRRRTTFQTTSSARSALRKSNTVRSTNRRRKNRWRRAPLSTRSGAVRSLASLASDIRDHPARLGARMECGLRDACHMSFAAIAVSSRAEGIRNGCTWSSWQSSSADLISASRRIWALPPSS